MVGRYLIIIFSDASETNLPISLIDFFGTMPLMFSETAVLSDELATASLL